MGELRLLKRCENNFDAFSHVWHSISSIFNDKIKIPTQWTPLSIFSSWFSDPPPDYTPRNLLRPMVIGVQRPIVSKPLGFRSDMSSPLPTGVCVSSLLPLQPVCAYFIGCAAYCIGCAAYRTACVLCKTTIMIAFVFAFLNLMVS